MYILFICVCVCVYSVIDDHGGGAGGEAQLVTDLEECSHALINLLLTGKAVKHLHNGSILYDDDNGGKLLVSIWSLRVNLALASRLKHDESPLVLRTGYKYMKIHLGVK